jgi:4-amino-4-deoxy-L-arabinose transferase-like glycosyltransferase
VALFGLNEFSVRFISAIFGSLTILLTYLLAKRLSGAIFKEKESQLVGLIAALFLAVEPWHVHFSRIALESNLSLFFVTLGIYFLNKSRKNIWGYLALVISFFTYLAPRLFVLILALLLTLFSRFKKEKRLWRNVAVIFVLLFLTTFLNPESLNRVKGISIFHPFIKVGIESSIQEKIGEHNFKPFFIRLLHNKPVEYTLLVIKQYLNYFSPDFLFFRGEIDDKRFTIPFMGNLLLFELPFFLIGLYVLLRTKKLFLLCWLFVAPLPSTFSFRSPSSVRSIFILPAFEIIAAIGLIFLINKISVRKLLSTFFFLLIIPLFIINTIYLLDNYFIHQLVHNPFYWNYGFKEAVLYVKNIEQDYDKIIVGKEGSPYIHFLFFQQMDPHEVWAQIERSPEDRFGFQPAVRVGKYYFNQDCPIGKANNRILYVCERDITREKRITILKKIDYRNGAVNLIIFKKNEQK